jgi:hypothetical protein
MSIKIKDLKVGDIIYQSNQRVTMEVEVKTSPEFKQNDAYLQWSFIGKTCDGEIEFMETEGLEHYGPKLSRQVDYTGDIYKIDGTIEEYSLNE